MPEDIGFRGNCPAEEGLQTPWHPLMQRSFQK